MPLSMAAVGQINSITRVSGRDNLRQHLAELGFIVGAEVIVISKIGGNIILSIKNSRIALDKSMANRIMV